MRKLLVFVAVLVIATACGRTGPAEPATRGEPVEQDLPPLRTVIAEASVEPARWVELNDEAGGTVVQVLVEEGDTVEEGELLLRFDPTDAQLAIEQAEAQLAMAEAQLALVQAEPRPEEIKLAENQVAVADLGIAQAQSALDQLQAGAITSQIAAANAQVASAQAQQLEAVDRHDATMKCFTFKNPYTGEKQKVCPNLGPNEELARAQMHAADDALSAAEVQLRAARGTSGPQIAAAEAGIESAEARRDASQARLELARAGNTPEQVASAEAHVKEAQAALASAVAALDKLEISAPFAGTVVEVAVEAGDTAPPGRDLVVLATLDQLLIRTTDLTELEFVRVRVGLPVEVTVDALPGALLAGKVSRIGDRSVDYRGDVTYPVEIELDEPGGGQGLRWGMTALVEIDVQ
jgi:multidrug efflux pump subunit AcrA (membrane-fusion protein)